MRLKHLELQGYKTFATRTDFEFDGGITAIVGPNGSGKSNIADALRWVLGEQSSRALRAKRTEDMIFSGSSLRSRQGMASASLILDNSDGWLPSEFAEVTVGRRAYRSGDSEYLLNGRRVRLRDVVELLSTSGLAQRTYTVIGQGLVDAVLSLRADDRRALFEEAAGISLHRAKRSEALARLEETRRNLLRVSDIVHEITPRLGRLRRQAERAELQDLLSGQLDGLLRTWYGYRWRQMQLGLQRAEDARSRRELRLERRREALEAVDGSMSAVRSRQAQLRDQLGAWHRESSDLHRQMEQVQRDLAVWQERSRLLSSQSAELETEVAGLEVQHLGTVQKIDAGEAEVGQYLSTLREREAEVGRAQAVLDELEERRATLSESMAKAQARILDQTTHQADCRSKLARIRERKAGLTGERDEHTTVVAEHERELVELGEQIRLAAEERDRLQAQLGQDRAEAESLRGQVAQALARRDALRTSLADKQHAVDRVKARSGVLSRQRDAGEGLREGVRNILRASRRSPEVAPGVLGTVAQLVHVPAELEAAIEVALGGHVQDIIVQSWNDAEQSIRYLRREQRGRATFLPLDTVRTVPQISVPEIPGIVGVANKLVASTDELAAVVEMLLGRTVVVEDLSVARRVFKRMRGGFQIVTLQGEVLRSSGSVTGGRGQRRVQGQALALEREWRELPSQLEDAEVQVDATKTELAEATTTEQRMRERAAALDVRLRERGRELAQASELLRDSEREAVRTSEQLEWRGGLAAKLEEEGLELAGRETKLRLELDQLEIQQTDVEEDLEILRRELDELPGELLYQRLSEARTTAAVARGTWQHRRTVLETQRQGLRGLRGQIKGKRDRIGSLRQERETLAGSIAEQESQQAVVQGWLSSLLRKIEPSEDEIARLDAEHEALSREEVGLRGRLRDAESSHSQSILAYSRQEDRLARLRRQIVDDFGLVEMEPTEGLPEQLTLPLAEMVSSLPVVKVLPEGLEGDIHRIKTQISSMGSVNPNAPSEFAEIQERYEFLTSQAADLEDATDRLRQVIRELDELMRREFHETFERVSAVFEGNFVELFGGGSAQLQLTEPDDLSTTGVEIVARPPGKRQQTLALLSGGERSLTAVALIFALLETNPPPFCILDEVDAMLDEANVQRFRSVLERLSKDTQFIVITHNRGTIEAADTIYGVSMGDDSVSQVVSLRLHGEKVVTS